MKPLPTTTASSAATQVNYTSLVASFEQGIEKILRGFRPPDAPDWLDLWVHDEDHVLSILNVFEAGQTFGLEQAVVRIEAPTLEAVDLDRLEQALTPLGTVNLERGSDGVAVRVQYGSASAGGPLQVARKTRSAASRPSGLASPAASSDDLGPYQAGIARLLDDLRHDGELSEAPNTTRIQATLDDATVALNVDEQHVVRGAAHTAPTAPGPVRGFLEQLCRVMLDRPLLDCAEHGAQYVNAELRAAEADRAVPGIAMPHNSHALLGALETLTRRLLAEYRQATGFDGRTNMYRKGPADAWRDLTRAEREERIQAVLDEHCVALGLPAGGTCVDVKGNGSVALSFPEPVPTGAGKVLLRLEILVKELDPALYIHLEEMRDKSKLRRL